MQRGILLSFLAFEVLIIVALGGCGTTFDHAALKARPIDGDGFSAALAREYRELARYEADEMYDWPDAGGYGEKALQAAFGELPSAEKVSDWRIPRRLAGEFVAARARLVSAVGAGGGVKAPAVAARAQSRFDCWLEQQEENWQFDHIARCRTAFYEALADLEKKAVTRRDPLLSPAIVAVPSSPAGSLAFTVHFDFDSDALGDEERRDLRALAESLATTDVPVRILVAGHADRAGAEAYNQSLSLRRGEAVRVALTDLGVPASRIELSAYGERRPKRETPDGVREPANRRVEIFAGVVTDS